MAYRIIPIFVMVLINTITMAQSNVVSGIIHDEKGSVLDLATVSLSDSGKFSSTLLAEKGLFRFVDVPNGKYQLKITMVGYGVYQRNIIVPADSIRVVLLPDNRNLKEVVITANRPLIERKIDRVIFNLENSVNAHGISVWDALGKSPGVQTTFSGGVKANGKGVEIYLDDKPLRLSGDDLSTYLKSLPSDYIAKIEIIANPPSRYDAQGGGIINLISKKSKSQGFNITLNSSYTQTKYGSYNLGGNFNYRKNKINVYGNINYSTNKKEHKETDYYIYETPTSYSLWEDSKLGPRQRKSANYKAGIDYNMSDNQVLGVLFTGFNGSDSRMNNVETRIYNNHKTSIDSLLQTTNNTKGNTFRYSYNVNYKLKLDTLGQALNFDVDYSPFRNKGAQIVNSQTFSPDGAITNDTYHINTLSDQKISIWATRVDYDYYFNKVWNFSTGIKYGSISSNNVFNFFDIRQISPILNKEKSDSFNYGENTSAAYFSLSGSIGKLNIQSGLRGEYTRTRGFSLTLDSLDVHSYFHIFPTVYLQYPFAKDHEVNVYYGYRIDRPEYSRLNPFKYYTSPYSYIEGNPGLKPAFISTVEIGYTYKQKDNISFYYRNTSDYYSNIPIQDNITKIYSDTQQNLKESKEMGFYSSITFNPVSWWEMNDFLQVSYRIEKSGFLEGIYDYKKLSGFLSTTNSFTLNKNIGLKAELSCWYSSPIIQVIYKIGKTFDTSAGLQMDMFNKSATIRLTMSDIFFTNSPHIDVNYLNQHSGFYETNDNRALTFAIVFKLAQRKIKDVRNRKNSIENEMNRTGQ